MSDELMCKLLPLLGVGTRTHIKAGHAALVLIENKTGKAQYFDFGRYVTPKGKGRVRGENTDVELEIPVRAVLKDGILDNLDEFLLWLDAHPEKTHGSGRLVASLCESIDYEKANAYISQLQGQGSIPYKAFGSVGSNCARFVTDTILASTEEYSIIKHLKWNKRFTPSTVGTVEKSASEKGIYEIFNGEISIYNSTALRENLTNYFDKRVPDNMHSKVEAVTVPEDAQFLYGIGSSAWFHLEVISKEEAIVRRYTDTGILDFEGVAQLPENFSNSLPYRFVYDSNCVFCTIKQEDATFVLQLKRRDSEKKSITSSTQMVHSA